MVRIVKICQHCQRLLKIIKIVKKCQNCQKLSKLSKIVKMLVRSCFFITLIKCLKGHRSLGSLFNVKKQKVAQWVSESVSPWQGHLLSCQVTAKNIDRLEQKVLENKLFWQIKHLFRKICTIVVRFLCIN